MVEITLFSDIKPLFCCPFSVATTESEYKEKRFIKLTLLEAGNPRLGGPICLASRENAMATDTRMASSACGKDHWWGQTSEAAAGQSHSWWQPFSCNATRFSWELQQSPRSTVPWRTWLHSTGLHPHCQPTTHRDQASNPGPWATDHIHTVAIAHPKWP